MNSLPTVYQQFIHKSRYARWDEELGRREEWNETVARYFNFFEEHLKDKYDYKVPLEQRQWLESMVLNLKAMPSMRAIMTAGPALKRENMAGFNCSYLPVDNTRAFDEILYILMNGTGVGFSVESKYVQKLPCIPDELHPTDTAIVVADSKLGWASSLRELIALLYAGKVPNWDTSRVRPAGERLKTFGGRASGPEPLRNLFGFTVEVFNRAKGRKLSTLECHDIVCKIAEVVVVGGVRRSALVSLGDINDDQIRRAKIGQWWIDNPQRALANNSWVANSRPSMETFFSEWYSLYESKSGERGLFSRYGAINQMIRNGARRDTEYEFGSNPCLELLLRPMQTCNLSEVVMRYNDNLNDLSEKIKAATILGTWQSTLDNFRFIRKQWSDNQKEERLLGVSLTGIYDWLPDNDLGELEKLKHIAIDVNKEEAYKLGINSSTGITCVKPSGTVSQLVDSSSGMHPRHSEYYIRTVRGDIKDPLTQFLVDQNIPCEPDHLAPKSTVVFSFPIKSPEGAICRRHLDAIEQLENYKELQNGFCEHKPSVTINVKEQEWLNVGAWVYNNIDDVIGVSFLPDAEHSYKQAPYQDCTKEEYELAQSKMPQTINWNDLREYEREDNTVASQELACAAGFCEII